MGDLNALLRSLADEGQLEALLAELRATVDPSTAKIDAQWLEGLLAELWTDDLDTLLRELVADARLEELLGELRTGGEGFILNYIGRAEHMLS